MDNAKLAEERATNAGRGGWGRFAWGFGITLILCVMGFELTEPAHWQSNLPVYSVFISVLMGMLLGLYGPEKLPQDADRT